MALRFQSITRDSIRRFSQSSPAPSLHRKSEDYYLQRSKIPTMHFQASLPRLPIPKLSETCQRYLAAQRPILNDNEYSITNELTLEFSTDNSQGWELNKQLIQNDKDNKHTSFISNYWFDMYLKDRRSIVLNHNPFMTFNADPRNPSQTDRASQIIWSAVRFHNSLRDNLLKPEVFHLNPSKSDKEWFDYFRYIPSSIAWYGPLLVKAFPLDMSQYGRLFGSTRIPRQLKDELTTSNDSRHVIIMKNDNMYMLNVMEPNGEPVDINHIYASLEAIKADSGPLVTHPISMLPTLDRDSWTAAREELVIDTHNAHQLELLDSALFVMSLDDSQPTEAIEATKVCLHNYGYNRWVDKSIQFIVCENASTAVSFEHAWGDGVAVLRLFNEVYDETTKRPRPLTPPTSPASLPEKLSFNLSDGVKKAIDKARERLKEKADSLSVNLLQFEKFGKNYLKSKKLSPDAVIQLAFQIAYYRQYNTSPSTYESCSTAAFRHGRTETIRPASIHTMNCAKSFQHDSGANESDKIKLIREAVTWHSKLVREAATGKGFDRHLFALKRLAESKSLSLPFFEDPSYLKLNTITLSTSTLDAPSVMFGGFAPVNDDSYGLGYSVRNDMIGSNIMTYPTRDGSIFIKNLSDVLHEMHDLFESDEFNN